MQINPIIAVLSLIATTVLCADREYLMNLRLRLLKGPRPSLAIEEVSVDNLQNGFSSFDIILKRSLFPAHFVLFRNIFKLKFHPQINVS
jgi:hypothetical protein